MAPAASSNGDRLRVLIVDDDAGFVEALKATLAQERALEVVGAATGGEQAVDLAEELDPLDVILLDIEMPGMDGIETMQALRKSKQRAAIVMLTGTDDHESLRRAQRSGPDGFLLKSLDPDEVVNGILIIGHLFRAGR